MRLRLLRRRDPDDFADEIRAHVDLEAARLEETGVPRDEARRQALRAFGNPVLATERVYDASRWRWLERGWQDLRYGARRMRRTPGFTAVAVLVLSLGIGANTAFFSVVNALFFRPLPVEAPGELVYLYSINEFGQTIPLLHAFDDPADRYYCGSNPGLFTCAYRWRITQPFSVDGETEALAGEWVDGTYFDLLGVKPVLGRTIGASDADASSPECPVVISHDLWVRRFKADPHVLGTRVRIDDKSATVVGVMGPEFHGLSDPLTPVDYWIPAAQVQPQAGLAAVARMNPGVSFDAVRAFVAAGVPVVRRQWADRLPPRLRDRVARRSWTVRRASDVDLPYSPEKKLVPTGVLAALTAVAGLVLLIATSNIAGLLLARGVTRTSEVAVRRALGAAGPRLARQLLTESLLLSAGGGAGGLLLSYYLVRWFEAAAPARFAVAVPVDMRVLLFATAVCVGAGLLVGIAPVFQAARVNVLEAIGRGVSGGRRVRARLRHWVVVPQIALSLVLLIVAGVHVHALLGVEATALGYQTDDAIVFEVGRWERLPQTFASAADRSAQLDAEAARVQTFNRRLLEGLPQIPEVTSAALTDALALDPLVATARPVSSREAFERGASPPDVALKSVVSDDYFRTMSIPVLGGRSFDARDDVAGGAKVAVISERLARELWPTGDAVGQELAFIPDEPTAKIDWLRVVGVVGDVHGVLPSAAEPAEVYVPVLQQWRGATRYLIVRGTGDRASLIRDVSADVRRSDTYAEILSVRPMRQMASDVLYPRRAAAAVLAAAGLVGLALACLGLYGAISYSVAQRLSELGVRAALGANRRDLLATVLREGAGVASWGLGIGVALAVLALRLTAGIIPGVPRFDGLVFVAVPIALGATVLAACYPPARRAAGIDPSDVLRSQ